MHIEPEAREIMLSVLENNAMDCIRLEIVEADGRPTISLGIGDSCEADSVVLIDGVKVWCEPETLDALENIVFLVQDGKLAIVELGGCGCGCGGHQEGGECGCGCDGHDGEGECGCDGEHHHQHEGGCGCGHNHQ